MTEIVAKPKPEKTPPAPILVPVKVLITAEDLLREVASEEEPNLVTYAKLGEVIWYLKPYFAAAHKNQKGWEEPT